METKHIFLQMAMSVASVIGMFTVSCSNENDVIKNLEPLNINLTRSESQALKGVNKFTFELMREVDSERGKSSQTPNFVLSPQGAAWCLAMVANGVEYGSESETELFRVLGFENGESIQDINEYSKKLIDALVSDKAGGALRIANAVYFKSNIEIYDDFKQTLNTFYDCKEFPNPINSQIDKWVEEQSNGKIHNFGTDNNIENKSFGVLNTILFEGDWHSPFNPKNTKQREFRNEDGTVSNPETMSDTFLSVLQSDEICHMLKVSLKNKVFSIHFALPTAGHNISDVIKHLNGEIWDNLNRPIENSKEEDIYCVRLPKFKLSENHDIFQIASNMGLKTFISGGELTRLCKNRNFEMTGFLQSTSFEINESGVKVSSSTKYDGEPTAVFIESKDFFMDEPFLFFITEESTGAILFAGKVGKL